MKKLLLGAVAIVGFFAGSELFAVLSVSEMSYQQQLDFINKNVVDVLEALGEQPIANAQFGGAASFVEGVRDVINFQAKSGSISASNKQNLVNIALLIEEELRQLKEETGASARMVIAKDVIKKLEFKLKTLDVGLTDYQMTVDLKNGLKKVAEAFLKALRIWVLIAPKTMTKKDALQFSVNPFSPKGVVEFCKTLKFEGASSEVNDLLMDRCKDVAPQYLAEVAAATPGTEAWSKLMDFYFKKSQSDKLYEVFLFDLQARQEQFEQASK